jgi:hypothetical protein
MSNIEPPELANIRKTAELEQRIADLEHLTIMSSTEPPTLTENKEVNNQLIVYFWWLILLSFVGQLIGYLIQYISGTISATILGILALGAIQTLLIGGAVKLVQKQMESITNKYNLSIREKSLDANQITKISQENADLKK